MKKKDYMKTWKTIQERTEIIWDYLKLAQNIIFKNLFSYCVILDYLTITLIEFDDTIWARN